MTFNLNNLFNMVSTNTTTQQATTAPTVTTTPAPQNEVPTTSSVVENSTIAPVVETQSQVTEPTTVNAAPVTNEDVTVTITNEPTISISDLVGAESQQQPLVPNENTNTAVQPIQESPAVIESNDAQLDAVFGTQEAVTEEEQSMTDLFGELSAKADEAEEKREQEIAESQAKKADSKKDATKANFDVNLETTIRIGGGSIPLTTYFTPEEITQGVFKKGKGDKEDAFVKISAEDVRARLEKDYPEFVKGFSTITYHGSKRNFIVAVPVGKTKGNK